MREQFKVGDHVEVIGETSWSRNKIGVKGTVSKTSSHPSEYEVRPDGYKGELPPTAYWSRAEDLKLINMKLETTKEKVLAAAATSDIAKKLLQELHPEAFENEWVKVTGFFPLKKGETVVLAPAGYPDADFYVPKGLKVVEHPELKGYYRIEKK